MLLALALACSASLVPNADPDGDTAADTGAPPATNSSTTTPAGTTTTPPDPWDAPVRIVSYGFEDASDTEVERVRHVGELEGWATAVVWNVWPLIGGYENEEHDVSFQLVESDGAPLTRIDHTFLRAAYERDVASAFSHRDLGGVRIWALRAYGEDGELVDCLVVAENDEELEEDWPAILDEPRNYVEITGKEELLGCRTEVWPED